MDLRNELKNRKYKKPNPFFYFIYWIIMAKIVIRKYNATVVRKDKITDCKGPCFLIWNHLSRLDHIYVMKAAWPRRINIVAGYNEFFRSHLHTVFKLNQILPKKNYTTDIPGLKAIQSIINQNGVVAFSPEGMSSIYGTNQPVVAGTGHYFKHYKIPVYFVKMEGEYLTSTKVCLDERKGKTKATLSLLWTPEDLEKMTDEEIDLKLNELFRHDDYAWNKTARVKWNTHGEICKNLREICYRCPKCNEEFTMESEKNYIRCKACGNGATMDDYYDFHPYENAVIPESPSQWVAREREQIIREIRADENYSFAFHTKIGCIPNDHLIPNKKTSEPCGDGILTFDHAGIHFTGTKFGEAWSFDLSYGVVYSLIITVATDTFSLYVNGEFYEFLPEEPVVGKALLVTEEMHRLHFNTWKNFPWNDFMYQ